ncbi:MAG: hypothetical protein M1818_004397 [Claussenomyces sp. TS43310]|nr:MAG: hypothetical protein M1818_004397 [Claussenomyces sp. TS43310]
MSAPASKTPIEKPDAPASVETTIATDQAAGTQITGRMAPETKSEVELAADKLYEERIEDEYAKREGGA